MTFKKPKSLPGSIIESATDPAVNDGYTVNAGSLWLDIGHTPAVLYERNSQNTGWNILSLPLPSQENNSGRFLTTDGSNLQWSSLPFAEFNVIGSLADHAADGGIHDFYLNTTGAKALRKITVTCLSTPASGSVVADIKVIPSQGGEAISLFPSKTLPTVACVNGVAWVTLTGNSLDTTSIPNNSVIVITVVSAPVNAADLRVELFA